MELRLLLSVLFMFSSGLCPTAFMTPFGDTVSARRSKRCSCATFLDKECVYFCHLDIIWVNTPERTVSYGLGDAHRKKRASQELVRTAEHARCSCVRGSDGTCVSFCRTRSPLRRRTARDKVIPIRSASVTRTSVFKREKKPSGHQPASPEEPENVSDTHRTVHFLQAFPSSR